MEFIIQLLSFFTLDQSTVLGYAVGSLVSGNMGSTPATEPLVELLSTLTVDQSTTLGYSISQLFQ